MIASVLTSKDSSSESSCKKFSSRSRRRERRKEERRLIDESSTITQSIMGHLSTESTDLTKLSSSRARRRDRRKEGRRLQEAMNLHCETACLDKNGNNELNDKTSSSTSRARRRERRKEERRILQVTSGSIENTSDSTPRRQLDDLMNQCDIMQDIFFTRDALHMQDPSSDYCMMGTSCNAESGSLGTASTCFSSSYASTESDISIDLSSEQLNSEQISIQLPLNFQADKTLPKRVNKKLTKKSCLVEEISDDEKSRYVAMDCEMVGVGYGGRRNALARVSIVDWYGKIVFDTYVKVNEPITDLRTFVSGIRLSDVDESSSAMEYEECRATVWSYLSSKIIVGHGLKNDLQVLNLHHPWYNIRDTAKYEPFMKKGEYKRDYMLLPRKLKDLAMQHLDKRIQEQNRSHCPIEDALAAFDLYKLARTKWEKVVEYKIMKTNNIKEHQKYLIQ